MILWANTSSATWRACKRARFEVDRCAAGGLARCKLATLRARNSNALSQPEAREAAMQAAAYLGARDGHQVVWGRRGLLP